jgi:ATP-dependent Clp endopeptidase proteolytic subunit ClpP
MESPDLKGKSGIEILHEYGVDLERRTVYLFGEFGGDIDFAAQAMFNLRYLDGLVTAPHGPYSQPITLVLDSPGGSDIAMYNLYDTITTMQSKVDVLAIGQVCSAAALIIACGTGKRMATPNCMFMTHKGKADLGGDDDEIEAQAELQKLLTDRYWKLLERHTKLEASKWLSKSKHKGELWLTADQMLEFGVIDEIVKTTVEYPALSTKRLRTRVKVETSEDEGDE